MRKDSPKYKALLKCAGASGRAEVDLRSITRALTRSVQSEVCRWKPTALPICGSQTPPLQAIDFFCGCGGMSLGFAALSRVVPIIEMVGGVDINADALATYNHNFAAPGVRVDIRTLVDDDAALANFLDMLPRYNAARPTIVIGCAPCQGFTSHRKRHWGTDDHRNTLVGAFTSVAIKLNADCVVMENVPEMLSLKYWDHFNDAKVLLEEAGYTVSQTIYSAASFGVPQERFRALVVAMKRPFLLPELQISEPSRYRTVRDAIGKLPLVSPGVTHPRDPMHRSAAHRESTLHTIRAVPKDGGSRPPGVGPKCLDRIRGFYDVYGRLAWDRPAITITHYARNPASGRYVHPEQDRGLTAREAALLQSFPLGFSFTGGFDSVFKQIGEAVSPRFAAAVAANCLVEMLSAQPTHEQCDRSVQPITTPVSSSFSSVIAGLKRARNRR